MNALNFATIAANEPLAVRLLREIVGGDRNAIDRARLFLNAVAPHEWPPLRSEAIAQLIALVAAHFGFAPVDLVENRRRTRGVTRARHVAMYLCRELFGIPFEELAPSFQRHHTTIIHACNSINDRREADPFLAEEINTLIHSAEVIKLPRNPPEIP